MEKLLNETSEIANTIYGIASKLEYISSALDTVGNDSLAEELNFMAIRLIDAQQDLRKAVGKEIHRGLQESQKQAGETISLVLNALVDQEK